MVKKLYLSQLKWNMFLIGWFECLSSLVCLFYCMLTLSFSISILCVFMLSDLFLVFCLVCTFHPTDILTLLSLNIRMVSWHFTRLFPIKKNLQQRLVSSSRHRPVPMPKTNSFYSISPHLLVALKTYIHNPCFAMHIANILVS